MCESRASLSASLGSCDRETRAVQSSQRRKGAVQPLHHAAHLPLTHLREERQRERARGDILAHRELPLAVAEALSVEAHQGNCRQIRLALDPPRGERANGLVAVDLSRQLHDEKETPPHVTTTVLVRD